MSGLVEVRVPRENVNDDSVTICRWIVADGDHVSGGQSIAEIETSKTTVEIEAPCDGFLRHTHAEGADVPVGSIICCITESADTPVPKAQEASASSPARTVAVAVGGDSTAPRFDGDQDRRPSSTRFSRRALDLVESRGLDAAQFQGRGLVREHDVLAALGEQASSKPAAPLLQKNVPTPATGVPYRREALSRQKRTEAKSLGAAHSAVLPSGVTVTCATRGLRAAALDQEVIRGNATALIVHEAARLLRQYPALNAFCDNGEGCYYEAINIGFAVDGDHGLKVPVIQSADEKDLATIADEMENAVLAYVEDRLPVEVLAGATFTITDLSGEGVATFHPIINDGQSAILGVGAEQATGPNGAGVYALILAFDHRLSAGQEAARFLSELRDRLAAYENSFLQGKIDRAKGEIACSVCFKALSDLPARVYMLQRWQADGVVVPVCSTCAQGY